MDCWGEPEPECHPQPHAALHPALHPGWCKPAPHAQSMLVGSLRQEHTSPGPPGCHGRLPPLSFAHQRPARGPPLSPAPREARPLPTVLGRPPWGCPALPGGPPPHPTSSSARTGRVSRGGGAPAGHAAPQGRPPAGPAEPRAHGAPLPSSTREEERAGRMFFPSSFGSLKVTKRGKGHTLTNRSDVSSSLRESLRVTAIVGCTRTGASSRVLGTG